MESQPPVSLPRSARRILALCGLIAVTATGARVAPAEAAPLDDCLLPLPPLPCVTLPPLPMPEVPGATPTPATPSGAAPATQQGPQTQAATEAFTYAFTRLAATRKNGVRRIVGSMSLTRAATFVAVLRRRSVPYVVTVETRLAGTSAVSLAVPKRVRAGRYTLDLVLGLGDRRYTVKQAIAIPK